MQNKNLKLKIFFLVIIFCGIFGVAENSWAAMINAASCSYADVSAAIAAASAGDTVSVPAGNCTWNNTLTITKGIQLIGAGKGNTIIINGITPGYEAYLIIYVPISPELNEPLRVTGFEVDGAWNGGGLRIVNYNQSLSAIITNIRLDHNYIHDCGNSSYPMRGISIEAFVFGIADNNEFKDNQKSIDIEGGDALAWMLDPQPGSSQYFFVEDNTFNNTGARVTSLLTSGGQGSRYVWRHNLVLSMYDCQTLDIHGNLGSYPDGNRGTVSAEIYDNNIIMALGSNCGWNQFLDMRGGTNLVYNNAMTAKYTVASGNTSWQLREEHCASGVICAGWNALDGGIYPCADQVQNTFLWNNTSRVGEEIPVQFLPLVTTGSEDCIRLNRDYWLPESGLESGRPVTCVANTFYAATDTGVLSKCISSNTWTMYYTPYTYPHPLRNESGDIVPPNVPSGLSVE